MAASDQTYRNQRWLDIAFGVTSVLMLFSIVWMFVDDYNREWKPEQRRFRDVETAIAQRLALENMPSGKEFKDAEGAVEGARKKRADQDQEYKENLEKIKALAGDKQRSEMRFNDTKADLESIKSFYDLETEYSPDSSRIEEYEQEVARLEKKLAEAKKEKDQINTDIAVLRQANDKIEGPVAASVTFMKQVTDKFDSQVKTAILKRWSVYDSIRAWPIIDGFASPLKIQQFTIEDIPIDYNFKYVTRFDRCMTCHQGIDRPAYSRSMLASLVEATEEQKKKLEDAREILRDRKKAFEGLSEAAFVPDPDELKLNEIPKSYLTQERINQFAAHPRLDLFVGSNSKHPAEAFGCSACHSGQGSATSFSLASHTPNDFHSEERWKKEKGWYAIHDWDFPMLPQRFIESSCIKCHYEVTDLIGSNNRQEAPKLLKGYFLLRENGCFGCHEINGRKKGREVGPDVRLENFPPLEDLTPAERTKIEADPDTRPGIMRKVGPSLFRIVEKTNPQWTAKWIRSPRDFRPDTKMPHFYGLTNNNTDVLPEEQKKFPDAEIQSITYVLFEQSKAYLAEAARLRKEGDAGAAKDRKALETLMNRSNPNDADKKVIGEIKYRMRLRQVEPLVDRAKGYTGDAAHGRLLFSERGCLACHSHGATTKPQGDRDDKKTVYVPAMESEAQFGPNLSQLAGKIGTKANDPASARTWLIQWIMDPHQYSPRSRMPVTHLTGKEAADIAAWLLAQPARNAVGPDWKTLEVKEPELATLKSLARVYLIRLLSQSNLQKMEQGKLPDYVRDDLPLEEKELAKNYGETGLKMYLGRKAIGRLGCFACHDIPGFDTAKPNGVELNEWGKKDPSRLAFEDIKNYVKNHFNIVDSLTDDKGKPIGAVSEEGKKKQPYEKFYASMLLTHKPTRIGYLNQKLLDPRSYDYKRILAWDDRSRMPQFRFARAKRHKGESDADFEARAYFEEAQARESVMTFILGLVAEPIPFKSVNMPKGDRLAEVKGRQILEKYNCGGCHLIRPGLVEFKVNKQVTQALDKSLVADDSDHVFPESYNWVGPTPKGDTLTAFSINPYFRGEDLNVPLIHALRFVGNDKTFHDLRTFQPVKKLPKKDVVYPPPEALQSQKTLDAFMHEHGPYGGAFTNLLAKFLVAKDPAKYKPEEDPTSSPPKYSGEARIAGPPILIGQGERTQGEWLYQFLRKPEQIRKETVLRMPRFNMSPDEARALVSYFAGVERLQNTGIGLAFPFDRIPQQEELDTPYWRDRTAAYLSRLREEKTKDLKGKEITLLEQRLQELEPIWQQVYKDNQDKLAAAKKSLAAAETKRDAIEKSEKDYPNKQDFTNAVQVAESIVVIWEKEEKRLKALVESTTPKEQRTVWEDRGAYVTDGFRMLTKFTCVGCHQVGPLQPADPSQLQGPPLNLAAQRLQPGWTERWIANPQRFLPYVTVMPANFARSFDDKGQEKLQVQNLIAGPSRDQVMMVRDVLMILPRAAAMPENRYLALPLTGAKTGEKK
jgi:cbb3-type cytochrome oxidase cytochrome c subunit